MLNLLTEPLIRVKTTSGERMGCSLPRVLSLLAADAVAEFSAQRPHQRHPWHAFLVQLAAMALHGAGRAEVPADEGDWVTLIRALTPEWPDDEPWSLVAPPDQPAFLQPPVPKGDLSAFKTTIRTPDALDMLVTSRNHDLKAELMSDASPDDWLFALVSLQTMEGFMGQGNYGISRMNGGFSNRPALGIAPQGGLGAHFRRDVRVLLNGGRNEILRQVALKAQGGVSLVWLLPWDGVEQIPFATLDPLYIEICRRVRLRSQGSRIDAVVANSRKARIAADGLQGNTGDPWTPVDVKEAKALSITGEGFSYRRMVDLLLGAAYRKPILQELDTADGEDGLSVLARGLARGQGKTEGYHERVVPVSKEVVRFFRNSTDPLAELAKARVGDAGVLRGQVLRPALFSLLQKGPDSIAYGAKTTPVQAEPWLDRFEQRVDQTFFPDLWREAAAPQNEQAAIRREWIWSMADAALHLLEEATRAVPKASMRRYRAKVRSRDLFFILLRKRFPDLTHEDVHERTA
ncbi:MAG TPA: type I-E CRISPR-associated protein Cse1/CasA [Rhodospirillales bacterium]|jgi:CRISPR system Cascade subunit CasA|nr:type I-E CRISPR-associated protein Cse1/CasA [Rhodospirillales bacterium]